MQLAHRLLKGDRRALSRVITLIENNSPLARKNLALLHRHTGRAHIIGVTGPPGTGKSTIVDKLIEQYRKKEKKVGVIAVDPTSPFSGGALLGDRIRMGRHSSDKNVFVRSMGTRGYPGGLARSTSDAIKVLDAFGMDVVFVETVGAGQAEVDVSRCVHTCVVVEMPGLGDDIQAIKAGILEIGDIFVVNKADKDGVEKTVAELDMMLDLSPTNRDWRPPIIQTIAIEDKGIDELLGAIENHLKHLRETKKYEKLLMERVEREFREILKDNLTRYVLDRAIDRGEFDSLVHRIITRQIDPYSAADKLLRPFSKMVEKEKE